LQGFGRGVIDDELIKTVSAKSSDLRHALGVLMKAGKLADQRRDTKIAEEDVERALQSVPPNMEIFLSSLSKRDLFMLKEIVKSPGITTRELKELHNLHFKECCLRTIELRLKELELKGLLRSESVSLPTRGRAKRWYTCVELPEKNGVMAVPPAVL